MGAPNWCIPSPSRLTKSAKESPRFSIPIRSAILVTRSSGELLPGIAPRLPIRYSISLILAPFSGRHARCIIPSPCNATIASFESSSRLCLITSTALRSPKPSESGKVMFAANEISPDIFFQR